jgi:hypothetical protein
LAEANRKKVSIRWKLWVDKNDVLREALKKRLEKHRETNADDDESETRTRTETEITKELRRQTRTRRYDKEQRWMHRGLVKTLMKIDG